ncbi:MAG: chromophore lyase CpcT/CpeT [Saprospiraceae bacterium]|nr:chromophore lyase CpcT/CpeT [Saprospiraceae bacterium]
MKTIFLTTIFMLLGTITFFGQNQKVKNKDLKKVAKMMTGTFSSAAQAAQDTNYFNIKLRMTPIWKDEADGYWFYVEQAIATAEEKPYRQRVYHLYLQDKETIVSKVYEVQNPKEIVNAWKDDTKLSSITREKLVDRQGCSIFLHKNKEKNYSGSTPGKECLSTLRGASYATSEVTIYKDRLESWDRGWDKEDKQVWGAENGGYVFMKEK